MFRKNLGEVIDVTPSLEYRQSFLKDNTCPQCGEEYKDSDYKCSKCALIITQE